MPLLRMLSSIMMVHSIRSKGTQRSDLQTHKNGQFPVSESMFVAFVDCTAPVAKDLRDEKNFDSLLESLRFCGSGGS